MRRSSDRSSKQPRPFSPFSALRRRGKPHFFVVRWISNFRPFSGITYFGGFACNQRGHMEIEVFALCDAAADYQGRLSILGIFDSIIAGSVPAIQPHCSVALRLRLSKIEEGKHSLTLHFVDNDGKMIIPPLNGEFMIQLPGDDRHGAINLVLNLEGLTFQNYGEYAVNLAIDNHELGSVPFWVKQPV